MNRLLEEQLPFTSFTPFASFTSTPSCFVLDV